MTTILVDTSALIALLDGDDPRCSSVRSAFEAHVDADFMTHGYVIAETLAVARRRLGLPAVQALIDHALPVLRLVEVDTALHAAALATYRASLPSAISFVDRVSLAVIDREAIVDVLALDPDLGLPGVRLLPTD